MQNDKSLKLLLSYSWFLWKYRVCLDVPRLEFGGPMGQKVEIASAALSLLLLSPEIFIGNRY